MVGNGVSSPISSASSSCPGRSTCTKTARLRMSSKKWLEINFWNLGDMGIDLNWDKQDNDYDIESVFVF